MIRLFDEVPHLENEYVELRKLEEKDAEALGEMTHSSRVYRYLPTFLFEKQYEDPREVIRLLYGELFHTKQSLILGIFDKAGGDFCGLAEYYGLKQDIQKKKRRQKPGFKFHMIGLKAGDLVIFDPLGIQVKVASADRVEYEGRLYSLSSFTGTFLPADKQNNSGVYAGPKYFSYKGETLYKLRNESESQKPSDEQNDETQN